MCNRYSVRSQKFHLQNFFRCRRRTSLLRTFLDYSFYCQIAARRESKGEINWSHIHGSEWKIERETKKGDKMTRSKKEEQNARRSRMLLQFPLVVSRVLSFLFFVFFAAWENIVVLHAVGVRFAAMKWFKLYSAPAVSDVVRETALFSISRRRTRKIHGTFYRRRWMAKRFGMLWLKRL